MEFLILDNEGHSTKFHFDELSNDLTFRIKKIWSLCETAYREPPLDGIEIGKLYT